jgi:hypothetical protein
VVDPTEGGEPQDRPKHWSTSGRMPEEIGPPDAPAPAPAPPPAAPKPEFQGGLFWLVLSSILLGATAMMPWWLRIEGFGGEQRVYFFQYAYESWEGRVTLAALLVVALEAAATAAGASAAGRARHCLRLLFFAFAASIAPTVYLFRAAVERDARLLELTPDRLDVLGPGLFVTLLALVGVGFGASATYRRERRRARGRIEKA